MRFSKKTVLACFLALAAFIVIPLAVIPLARAQSGDNPFAAPVAKTVEAPGAEYTQPVTPPPAPAAVQRPAPAQRSAPAQTAAPAVAQPAAQQAAQSAAPARAAAEQDVTEQSAAAANGTIYAPLVQSAPGTRGALVQEHQMEQLRAILAPVPARPQDIILDETKQITDEYKETTIGNIARMYWAVGKFQDDDNVAIDNYLLITECKLYQQYYENDFEWKDIRAATREFIHKNLNKMPIRFEAVVPIELGRYDVDTKTFALTPASEKDSLLRIEIETNQGSQPVCGVRGDIKEYPRNIVVRLNRPFTLKSFPTDPEIAALYIQQTRLAVQNMPMNQRMHAYKRVAYLRLKLRMLQFKEDTTPQQQGTYAVIFAALEGWDVFADDAEKEPMYSYMYPKGYLPKAFGFGETKQSGKTKVYRARSLGN